MVRMMRCDPFDKWLFLHIPKTGGAFVESCLDSLCEDGQHHQNKPRLKRRLPMRHALQAHLMRHDARLRYPAFTFTFVRHPETWYPSFWRYTVDSELGCPGRIHQHFRKFDWHPCRALLECWDYDINRWLRNVLRFCPMHLTRMYDLYCGPEGGEAVDFIGRQETLRQDVRQLFGRSFDEVPRVNTSKTDKPVIDDGLLLEVVDMERFVVERFYGAAKYKRNYSVGKSRTK